MYCHFYEEHVPLKNIGDIISRFIEGTTNTPPTTKTSTKRTTTTRRTTKTTTEYIPPTTSAVTSAPSNPHKHGAVIAGVVCGVLLLLLVMVAVGFTLHRRNVSIPGLSTIQGFLNPNYNRMDDRGVVNV